MGLSTTSSPLRPWIFSKSHQYPNETYIYPSADSPPLPPLGTARKVRAPRATTRPQISKVSLRSASKTPKVSLLSSALSLFVLCCLCFVDSFREVCSNLPLYLRQLTFAQRKPTFRLFKPARLNLCLKQKREEQITSRERANICKLTLPWLTTYFFNLTFESFPG